MKRTFARVQTIKYLGQKSPSSYIVNLTGEAAFKSAQARRGGLNGIGLISGVNDNSGVIILQPKVLFTGGDNRNTLANWSGKLTNTYQVSGAFGVAGNSGLGLIYDSVTPTNTEATITSTWQLKANEGFVLRMFPYINPDKSTDPTLHSAFCFGNWRIIFYKEKVLLVRINENWTIAQEKSALDNDTGSLIGPRVAAGNGQPAQNTSAIYDVYHEVDSPEQSQNLIGNFYEVWVLPESGSGLHVAMGAQGFRGAKNQTFVPLPAGETGNIYGGSPLTAYTRSNAMFFQIGTMSFADSSLIMGPLSTPYSAATWDDSFLDSNISYNVRKNTPPGTDANVTHEIINDAYFQFNVNLTTTDSAYTPFVYWAQAALMAGAYLGLTEQVYDSNTDVTSTGNTPIVDVTPSCDGAMRRQEFEVEIHLPYKIENQLFAYNGNPMSFMLENKLANLSIGDTLAGVTPVITNGLITKNGAMDVARPEHTTELNAFKPYTKFLCTISDAWAILDEDIILNELPGDGFYLGDYVKFILSNGGFSSGQISISDTMGRVLPQAAYGETPCVVPRQDQTRGDYLRDLMDLYGFTLQLYVDGAGVWRMRDLTSTLAQIDGHDAVFSTVAANNRNLTYPGRFAVLAPLDWIRDNENFYNFFRVEGAEVRGRRLCQEYAIHESISGTVNVDHAFNFIGRIRQYPTVRNEGLRTDNEVAMALRSLQMRYGISGRLFQFETYFHRWFNIYDRIKVDNKLCQITRINGGGIAADRMYIVAQELA